MKMKERIIGPDIVRSLAIFCVIAGHFALNTNFGLATFDGSISMWLQAAASPFFAIGVPLFILLTGFLNAQKTTADTRYFKGITKVLIAYIIISIITIAFRIFYLDEQISPIVWMKKIFDFSAIQYAWYIEMWIGLYLLTPFLNKLWNAIDYKREKQILLVVLFILTALPDLFNRYGIYLAPAYWRSIYPLFFFFAGRYIADYKHFNMGGVFLAGFLLLCFLNPLVSTVVPGEHTTIQIVGTHAGVVCAPLAVLLFSKLVWIKKPVPLMKTIAVCSLDMYLCSYMIDRLVYPYFIENHYESQAQFGVWFFVIVPIVFILSFITAFIIKKTLRIV